jgi:hypothetical protein
MQVPPKLNPRCVDGSGCTSEQWCLCYSLRASKRHTKQLSGELLFFLGELLFFLVLKMFFNLLKSMMMQPADSAALFQDPSSHRGSTSSPV